MAILLAIVLTSCQTSPPTVSSETESETRIDTELVLNNAVLEQSNKQDNTVWKIKADTIVYSEDKQTAKLTKVVANLLQNEQIILKLSAERGKIQDNGNLIILEENIVASDPRNSSVIKSNLAKWRPQENLLLIKDKLTGFRGNLEFEAESGQYFTDRESLEINGNAIVTSDEPDLQLKSDRLIWNIAQNTVTSPGAVDLVRYDEKGKVTDKLNSDRGQVNLITHTATLEDNIELISLSPKIQAATDLFIWNYQQRIGKTDKPIQIIDRDRNISVTGNQGEMDLQQQIAKLSNGVRGVDRQKAANLFARELTWAIATEQIEATGNVIYEQADPQAKLTGDKAVGILSSNNITVTSNGKERVTSIIEH